MRVHGFTEESAPEFSIGMVDSGIQKMGSGGTNVSSEFDTGVTIVQVADEGIQFGFACCADHEDVIKYTATSVGLGAVGVDETFFKIVHEDDGKVGGRFGTHSCASCLQIVLPSEFEIVHR